MSTNQYWNSSKDNNDIYWDPIKLASSTIPKTPSYESLTDDQKLEKRVSMMEGTINQCNDIINEFKHNSIQFQIRIDQLIESSEHYLSEHYLESPSYSPPNMIESLIWLSYKDYEKKDILDKDLEEYFN